MSCLLTQASPRAAAGRPRAIARRAALLRRLAGCVVLMYLLAPAAAQSPPDAANSSALAGLYRVVKRFDFDERKQGNYDDQPMYWTRLSGQGLPFFNRGVLDPTEGDAAPPSFRLTLSGGGSIAYEYDRSDLIAISGSDYVIHAKIRADGLVHSRAFVVAYFADRFGREVSGSKRVSALVGATGATPEPFQPVRIDLPGDFPNAFVLRIQLWILQAHAWRDAPAGAVDPIVQHDVRGRAWFDDVSIYRLPRTQLRIDSRGAVLAAGQPSNLLIDVHNATPYPMAARIRVEDERGELCHVGRLELPAETDRREESETATLRQPLPPLRAGLHTATLDVMADEEVVLRRTLRFAVANNLPFAERGGTIDAGIDLGVWRSADQESLHRLIELLHCGTVKVGIPMLSDLNSPGVLDHFAALDDFLRRLVEERISPVGVMLTPETLFDFETAQPLHALLAGRSDWTRQTGPTLAHVGGAVPIWQVGAESVELRRGGGWALPERQAMRAHLQRFTSLPQLAVPERVFLPLDDTHTDIPSVLVDRIVPTPELGELLASVTRQRSLETWLTVDCDPPGAAPPDMALADFARRMILARTARASRWYAGAPFELSSESGELRWMPTGRYLPLRTLHAALGGRTATATLAPRPDCAAVVFEGRGTNILAVWTWGDQPGEPLEMYLGPRARAFNLLGEPVALDTADSGRTRFTPQPIPLLITDVDARLARVCSSVAITPPRIETHADATPPMLRMRNYFDEQMTGEIVLHTPSGWEVDPEQWRFEINPGEELSRALRFRLPPRELAGTRPVEVELILQNPVSLRLRFAAQLEVGLSDISMEVVAIWQGDTLVVEHVLTNHSEAAVSFTGFCDAPEQPRMEAAFLNVPPGERRRQRYEFVPEPGAAGGELFLGIRELGGSRRIQQLVEVPPR